MTSDSEAGGREKHGMEHAAWVQSTRQAQKQVRNRHRDRLRIFALVDSDVDSSFCCGARSGSRSKSVSSCRLRLHLRWGIDTACAYSTRTGLRATVVSCRVDGRAFMPLSRRPRYSLVRALGSQYDDGHHLSSCMRSSPSSLFASFPASRVWRRRDVGRPATHQRPVLRLTKGQSCASPRTCPPTLSLLSSHTTDSTLL